MKLFEIADHIEAILAEHVDHETGEITDEAFALLQELEDDREAIGLDLVRYAMGEKREAEAIKAQADSLAKRAKVHANRHARLKAYLQDRMVEGQKVSDDRSTIGWRKSTRVVIQDESKLPADCIRTIFQPDAEEIKKRLKAGDEVTGAVLETRNNIQIG